MPSASVNDCCGDCFETTRRSARPPFALGEPGAFTVSDSRSRSPAGRGMSMAWLTESKRLNRGTGKTEVYFSIAWREVGRVRTKGLGFIPNGEANTLLKVFEAKLALGQELAPPATASGSGTVDEKPPMPTLSAHFDDVFLPVVRRDKAPRSAASAAASAKVLKASLGELPLDRIDFDRVDRYVTERRGLGRRTRTVIIELWWLRAALSDAVDRGLIATVPKLPRPRNTDRRTHRFLSDDECRRLLDALAPLDVQPHRVTRGRPPILRDRLTYLAVLAALNLGLRKGEILSRGWEDVRWTLGPHGTLAVDAKPAIGFEVKTRRARAVPLTPEFLTELRREHERCGRPSDGWIFVSPHDPNLPRKDFGIALRRACRRAGIPVIHPHGLRHTWATRLAMAGVDRRTLMEVGGWTEGRMLDEIYAHTTDDHKAAVMGRSGLGRAPS